MSDANKTETILTDLRAELLDLLSRAPAKARFRDRIAAWCKHLLESDKPGAVPVDTGVATCFGSVGSLAMIAALMRRGPQDLDEAYVLLGAIHDGGPHVGRAGQASPAKWDTEAQSVSGEEDPRILDWAQHAEWHSVIDCLDKLTPEAVQRLPAWLEKVKGDSRPIRAGKAFMKAIESDPKAQDGLRKAQMTLRALAEAVRSLPPLLAAHETAARHIWQVLSGREAEMEAEREALAKEAFAQYEAFKGVWKVRYGEPYPESIEDLKRFAVRAGVSADTVHAEKWTPAEIQPLIEGYLDRLADSQGGKPNPTAVAMRACLIGKLRWIAGCLESPEDITYPPPKDLSSEEAPSPEAALQNLRELDIDLHGSEELAEALEAKTPNGDFYHSIRVALARLHEALGQPEVPVEAAMLDGKPEEALECVVDAMARGKNAVGDALDRFVAELQVMSERPAQEGAPAAKRAKPGEGMSWQTADALIRKYLEEHAKDRTVTVGELVKKIGCSRGTVSKCPAWQTYMEGRKAARQPRALGLTDKILNREDTATEDPDPADEIDESDELARLTAESDRENELDPSPFAKNVKPIKFTPRRKL